MKLLFDENLSRRLVESLAATFPGCQHVSQCGLTSADDTLVWQFARENGYAIVSKDSDFVERAVFSKGLPKVIWIRLGNCTNERVVTALKRSAPLIEEFLTLAEPTTLVLR